MIVTAEIRDSVASTGWGTPNARVCVVVSTHNRGDLLDGLLDALEAQTFGAFEVVVADNGSADDTWNRLTARSATTHLRLKALRLDPHDGPAVPRNTAVLASNSELVAFTDDDCLPESSWLMELVADLAAPDVVLVQGRTLPEIGGWGGPWGRSVEVTRLSGLYETANLAVRRTAFIGVDGFGAARRLTGRAFGEDVLLGAKIARTGTIRFASNALVRHRIMPGTYRDLLIERWRLRAFPSLHAEIPELVDRTVGGVFLSSRTATTDLGVASVAAAIVAGRRWLLVGAIPWTVRSWRESAGRPGRPRAVRAAQLLVADLAGLGALIVGSAEGRRLLL